MGTDVSFSCFLAYPQSAPEHESKYDEPETGERLVFVCFGSEILPQKNCCVVKCRVELSICLLVFAALEKKLLSHICENGERHLFSSIPSSGLPPGIPEVSSNAREPPYRTDTDTPTFTGDFRRVQKMVKTCWFF